ncbi:uncharacterized protein I303_107676 [Kwoniella dejecticola CBS 10117]|uniref:Uncharacterized protein n=1 Tax=Kwoniella dejecticola CBS 10117 TaxID=1296121 RepID=A0A1A5ZVD8_9TREE|nr:uncharacterized protein I303_07685 [Kwoniella dejecticola CBS 10117]OBR81775.1 hypothetical protein I303_07685 [Kwoniella dejecticola CBS 10117]
MSLNFYNPVRSLKESQATPSSHDVQSENSRLQEINESLRATLASLRNDKSRLSADFDRSIQTIASLSQRIDSLERDKRMLKSRATFMNPDIASLAAENDFQHQLIQEYEQYFREKQLFASSCQNLTHTQDCSKRIRAELAFIQKRQLYLASRKYLLKTLLDHELNTSDGGDAATV